MCLHFGQIRTWHRCLKTHFLRLVHLCEVFENCSIWLSNDWNSFYESTDHLQQFRADKFITSFKSEAFTFSSASVIDHELIQLWPDTLQHIERFSRPFCFIAFDQKMIPFYRFSLKLGFFCSLFFPRFSIMCRRVLNKTIILLGLAGYEMIITNSALCASLVIYHFISSAPS